MDQLLPNILQIDQTDFRIGYTLREEYYNMIRNHNHNTYEIYYLLSGERYYFIKDRTYHIKKGDMVLVNAYDLHRTDSISCRGKHERILIHISETFLGFVKNINPEVDLLSCFKKDERVIRLEDNDRAYIETQLYNMLNVYNNKDKYQNATEYLKIMTANLLVSLNSISSVRTGNTFEHPSKVHKKVSEIVTYINGNYMDNITLQALSDKFYLNKYYITKIFKEITGQTFKDYINTVRIKEAQSLLRETDLNVTRVSYEVGYESPNYFSEVFRKFSGCTPLKYRKKMFM